jgi:hypothetical protein
VKRFCLLFLVMIGPIAGRALPQAAGEGGGVCPEPIRAAPDSMVAADSGPTPQHLTAMGGGPRDAPHRAVIAHFVVEADGQVDTSTISVEHTNDVAWIARLRQALADAVYKPAYNGGCPVARWSTFAVLWTKP